MTQLPMRTRGAPALYRLLMYLYPASFRARFGAEMLQVAAELRRQHAPDGLRGTVRLWRLLVRDVATSLPRECAMAFRSGTRRDDLAEEPPRRLTSGDRMSILLQDLRYALRALRRAPGFAATVVLSLAIGIGANTLVYSVVDGVVLRPFDFPDPNRLVAVGVRYADDAERRFIESLSPPEYEDIRGGTRTLERFFAFDLGNRTITGGDYAERVFTALVWGDPFSTVGLRPLLGRGFTEAETTSPGSNLAILSHRVWQTRFGSDSGVIGRAVRVNGEPRTVIGVMPPALLLLGTDLWVPMGVAPAVIPRQARQFAIVGRMKAGATVEEVSTDLNTIAGRVARTWEGQHPEYKGWSLAASPWAEVVAAPLRQSALVMLGAVLFVLLLACANISSVMLARASVRQRELAVRYALGARTGRLVRQLLSEGVLLSFMGGAAGVAVATVLMGPALSLFPDQVRSLGMRATLNTRVLLLALAVTVAVGLVTSLAPVWRLARRRVALGLAATGRSITSARGDRRLRQSFTVVQIAIAVVLLAGASVMLRSMASLQRVDPGFDTSRLLTMRLSLSLEQYQRSQIGPFFETLTSRLEAVPGVVRAGAATQFPPGNRFDTRLVTDDAPPPNAPARTVDVTNVTEGLVAALGLRLRAGRVFRAQDRDSAPRVAMLNETAVRRFFPTGNAIGRRVGLAAGNDTLWHEVVGVVSDARNRGLDAPTSAEAFVPVRQQAVAWNNQLFLLIRTRVDPLSALPAVRQVIRAVDAEQPVYAIRTMESAFAQTTAPRRAAALLLTVFGAVALLLAAVGIYGILSYLVSVRTHEIGIRLALGARERAVVALVLRETALLVGSGVGIGLVAVLVLGGTIGRIAFDARANDPATLLVSVTLLVGTALVACWVPLVRATRVAPVEALRDG